MTGVFSTFLRQQLVTTPTLFNGVHVRAVVFRQSPSFGADDAFISGARTVADLRGRLGWIEATGTGWPVATDITLFVRTQGASHYATFSDFAFPGIQRSEVRVVAFYLIGAFGGVTNPLLLTTDTPFDGVPTLLDNGDLITANPDSTLSGTPNRYVFSWATPGTGVTAVPLIEGPLALSRVAPPFETSHAQHVWLYPQRANLLANPSFEAQNTNFWATNGAAVAAGGGVPGGQGGVWEGRFTGGASMPVEAGSASVLVVESNDFPTDGEGNWTIQFKAKGNGRLKVGFLWWDSLFDRTYGDWGGDEEYLLTPNSWVHIIVCRTGYQTFRGALRLEIQGNALTLDECLIEKGYLRDWPYFDGESNYGADGDYSWYGGQNLQGASYSLWYNNKKAIYGRIFAQDLDDNDVLTNEEVEAWGFVYRWVPAGMTVVPHIDVLYVNDLQAPVNPKTTVNPRSTAPDDTGVLNPWV